MSWRKIKGWRDFDGVKGELPDPYLIWAELTGWHDVLGMAAGIETVPISLLIELAETGNAIAEFRAAFTQLAEGQPALLPEVYRRGRYVTVWISRNRLGSLLDPQTATGKLIRRADLSMPIRALRADSELLRLPLDRTPHRDDSPLASSEGRRTLFGVIESGCPFARRSLLARSGSSMSTRIAAIWDMGPDAAFKGDGLDTAVPKRMGYGLEVLRGGCAGMDAWLAERGVELAAFDEQACYAEAGLTEMRARGSHGAHVLDLLIGPLTLGQRVAYDADSPPGWNSATDAAADADQTDIAFVQLPRRALADNSGAWLGSHVLDAANYLVSAATAMTPHVLINLSYGCTVGPHDGSSILECALDNLVARGTNHRGKVEIAVAAGNSFGARGHVMLTASDFDSAGRATPMVWRVLPGSETASFMQVWLPPGDSTVRVRVTAPGGASTDLAAGQVTVLQDRDQCQATAIFLAKSSRGEASPMILVVVAPTDTSQTEREPAAHGDWTLTFRRAERASTALAPGAQIHAWIARNDQDIGMPLRGRQSYFVDPRDEPSRYLRGCADDPGMQAGEIDTPADRQGAIVRRRGTLNGIASGKELWVCAGYRLRDASHAAYSSAGMKNSPRGRGPDVAAVSDESSSIRGVRAGGNASGAVLRLVGTSTAAPQYLRQRADALAKGKPLKPVPVTPPIKSSVRPPKSVKDPVAGPNLWGKHGRLPI